METLTIIIVLALIATIFVLAQGVISMVRGGKNDEKNCENLMTCRVVIQGIAVVLILAALFLSY